jgi:hypothetical protein
LLAVLEAKSSIEKVEADKNKAAQQQAMAGMRRR